MNKRKVSRALFVLSLILLGAAIVGIAVTAYQEFHSIGEGGGIIGGADKATFAFCLRRAALGGWGIFALSAVGVLGLSLILSPTDADSGKKTTTDPNAASPSDHAAPNSQSTDGETKGRYPLSLFLMGFLIDLITRNLLLTFAALVLSIVGIWVPECRWIGAGLLILSVLLSLVRQFIIRWHVLHDPPNGEFDEFRNAMLSKDWMKNVEDVMSKKMDGQEPYTPDENGHPDDSDPSDADVNAEGPESGDGGAPADAAEADDGAGTDTENDHKDTE